MESTTKDIDEYGGFLIKFPGVSQEQIKQALDYQCPECFASMGTHFPKCSLDKRKPTYIDLTKRTIEEVMKLRGFTDAEIEDLKRIEEQKNKQKQREISRKLGQLAVVQYLTDEKIASHDFEKDGDISMESLPANRDAIVRPE